MYYDTDAGGVVHNLAYLRWVEQARTLMASEMGIDYATLALEQNRHTVLVRHEVDYHSPAFLADDIVRPALPRQCDDPPTNWTESSTC